MFKKMSLVRMLFVAAVLCGLAGTAFLGGPADAGKPQPPPPPPPPTAPPYSFQSLGTLGGGGSTAFCINNSGDVVGESWTADGTQTAFLSTVDADGVRGMHDLNTLLEPADQLQWYLDNASGVNDAGQIVGYGHDRSTFTRVGYRYTPAYFDALGVRQPAVFENVVASGGLNTINNLGNVAGYGPNGNFWAYDDPVMGWVIQPFVTEPGGVILQTINLQNQVCGSVNAAPTTAFRFTPGQGCLYLGMIAYNRKGWPGSGGEDMDDNGQVVGEAEDNLNSHAFRYLNSMVDLGTLGGGDSAAHGINRSGTMIVGGSTIASGPQHLFLYTTGNGKMMDLEAAIVNLPPGLSGLLCSRPGRINNSGWVCGLAGPSSGPYVAYLLTPQ